VEPFPTMLLTGLSQSRDVTS